MITLGTSSRRIIAAALLLGLGACVAGSEASHQAAAGGALSQVVLGFWHGLIGPIMVIGEVINTLAPNALPWTVHFYESQHTGVLYDLGFLFGLVSGPSLLIGGVSRRSLRA
ncbi:MAG: hypothetical protein ABUS57_07400 [Pseudomonadota bacterium]